MSTPESPVFTLHRGGKIGVVSTVPLRDADDLSLAYTPGVAEVCLKIEAEPDTAYDYTWKGHTVAVVTDGTAVLGLGDIGPAASMPVMEGKALLFKQFGGVDAVPICPGPCTGVEEIIEAVDRDRAQPSAGSTWRTSPRRAASRSRNGCTDGPRHPGVPRRPARHRDRHARCADATPLKVTHRTLADLRVW